MVVQVWVACLNWQGEILADEAGLHQVPFRRVEDAIADYEAFLPLLLVVF
jgi:hypothetical protein